MRIKAVHWRLFRKLPEEGKPAEVVGDEMQLAIEFRNASRRASTSGAHLGNQKSAVFGGEKVIRDRRINCFR